MNKLDIEEKEILAAYDGGETTTVKGVKKELARHRKVAENTFKKDARINIRIASRDLRALQKRALAEGIPYQTLIASILHKYAEGRTI
ncbi:MAG: antitoxin [Acidobacteria bacterium]|nr:antitoxin [Acidobacteriota bacterium]